MQSYLYDFAIIGGDLRQRYLEELLKKKYKVICYKVKEKDQEKSLEKIIKSAKIILGPTPFSVKQGEIFHQQDGKILIKDVMQRINQNQSLIAGGIPEEIKKWCKSKEIKVFDLMDIEKLRIYNTVATAEGAILEAIKKSLINLHHSRCLILGFGRCGQTLAHKLKGLDTKVYICARKEEDRMLSFTLGYQTISFDKLREKIKEYDFIFNTVPKNVIDKKAAKEVKKEAIIIDIASMPGGIEKDAEKEARVYHCLGLPGKYAPLSSAEMMFKTVDEIGNKYRNSEK